MLHQSAELRANPRRRKVWSATSAKVFSNSLFLLIKLKLRSRSGATFRLRPLNARPKRRPNVFVGLKALSLLAGLSLLSSSHATDLIRVGAWNIETLGTPQSRDYRKKRNSHGFGVARQPHDLAAQIHRLDLDVLALTEIDDTDPTQTGRNNRVLDDTFQLINRESGQDWTYVLFPKYSHYANTQLTGIAWDRTKINRRGDWYRVRLGKRTSRYAEWDRHPHAIKFTRGAGRTDFVVIPIHMKAGRSRKAIDQRRIEAQALVAQLDVIAAHFSDDDIILVGDFNMTRSNEPAGKVFRSSGLVDLNLEDQPTHIAKLALDRCYVPRDATFDNVSGLIVAAPTPAGIIQFRREPSDHWPVVLVFEERADDD